jgi:hypothetical protein
MAQVLATRTPTVAAAVNPDAATLTLTFSDGRTLSLDATQLSESIVMEATLHGLKQKLVDAAAIARDPETGRSATLSDKYEAVKEVFDRIVSPTGTWNKIRSAGEAPVGGLFVRALMQLGGKSRAEVTTSLEALTKEQRSALRANKRVVEAMAAMREPSDASEAVLAGFLGGDSNDE